MIYRNLLFPIPSLISLEIHVQDALFAIRELLKCMPNLTHLKIKSSNTYLGNVYNWLADRFTADQTVFSKPIDMFTNPVLVYINGSIWEDIIINHLPKLKTFQLKMETHFWSRQSKEDEIKKILTTFDSHFWTMERRWFVRCEWNPSSESSYVCVYTLPYVFHCFDTHIGPTRSKSTASNESDYWLSDHVHNLHYDISLSSYWALCRTRFSNIRHLSIGLPFNDGLLSALSRFDHINSLSVYIHNEEIKVQNQLQVLLDHAPNLYSLRISCGSLSAQDLILLKNSSISVRCLDLYSYTQHEGCESFNREQCVALCNSSLGMQCEVLRIKVENPMDVLELVYSIPRLRALNVKVLNDAWNVLDFDTSPLDDELVQWLCSSLDFTCTVVRCGSHPYNIHLWIR